MAVLLDEIFGADNRVATITFCKTGATTAQTLSEVADYLLWYSKNKNEMKYHHLYKENKTRRDLINSLTSYAAIELPDGSARTMTSAEKKDPDLLPENATIFRSFSATSQHPSKTGRSEPFEWRGKTYVCSPTEQWTVSHEGLARLAEKNRLFATEGGALRWKNYESEIPGTRLNNVWHQQLKPNDLHYVVETSESVVERCILMSTDPGDLVLDITCGSGTTPFVAERWGRRWIATDASRVPIALARQRVLSGVYDWWVLTDSEDGIRLEAEFSHEESLRPPNNNSVDPSVGFVYKRVPYVSAATLAYDEPPTYTHLVDQPHKKKGVRRVASPFTVESLSPYRTVSTKQYEDLFTSTASHQNIEEALRVSGCTLKSGEKLTGFDDFEPIAIRPPITHYCTMQYASESNRIETAISMAPEDASCTSAWINHAANRAVEDVRIRALIIIAFNYEADSYRSTFQRGRLNVHCLRANRDLMIDNLQITASDQAFVEIGEPDIKVSELDDQISVEVTGYDTFNPQNGNLTEGTSKDIQCWMIDTNYDEKQFFARRFHFPGKDGDRQIKRFQRQFKKHIDQEEWKAMLSLKSTPFRKPRTGQIAVRIITNTGVEMTTVKSV